MSVIGYSKTLINEHFIININSKLYIIYCEHRHLGIQITIYRFLGKLF